MNRYEFRKDEKITQHGWLDVYNAQGNLLATSEEWAIVNEFNLQRMTNHECKPGQMIPAGDPRWYTHCQWCGESVKGQETAYYAGQYHFPTCYEQGRKQQNEALACAPDQL